MRPVIPLDAPASRRALALACAVAATWAAAPQAGAFGTINGLGQSAEHERITRAAVACVAVGAPRDCYQPVSIDNLAGKRGTFGAVGAPDAGNNFDPAAHCDNADFLAGGYRRTRAQATAELVKCRTYLQGSMNQAVTASAGMVDRNNRIIAREVDLSRDCTFVLGIAGRAKCNALEAFGRVLHGAQDFYSHSNWTDFADPRKAISRDNPPGLGFAGIAPFLALNGGPPAVPPALTTGCFSLVPVFGCWRRITHDTLNKDTGGISPITGATWRPSTPRGQIAGNFGRAVNAAKLDTRRQWNDLATRLVRTYGLLRGRMMVCALTHDDPVRDCHLLEAELAPYPHHELIPRPAGD